MNILLIHPEFPDTFWSFKHALSFVHRKSCNPPLGLITVAALLPQDWNVRLVDLNVSPLRHGDLQWADFAFIGAMDIQRDGARAVMRRCKAAGLKIVAGGPLFTGEYDSFPEVDHFILNEAEITLPQFLTDLAQGCPQRLYATEDYADITKSPVPRFDLLDLEAYDSMGVQFSRGCPYNCEFCNVTALLGHRPRTKTAAQLIAELDALYALGWRRNIFLVDDNFIGNKKELKKEILPALIEWHKKTGCTFITEASINLADDIELISLMSRAGFNAIFIGIETPSAEGLAECNKGQNRNRDLLASVKRLQRAGFQIYGGFIVGFDSDQPDIFQRQIDFIQQSGIICAMVGILQAPYGTQLYERMAREGRLLTEMTGDNADGTTNIIPHMDPRTLHAGYRHILQQIYSPRLFYQRVRTFLKEYKPARAPVRLQLQEILALFRSIWRLGILGVERSEYWKLFFWTLFTRPHKFPLAITLSIYGYHFRVVSEKAARVSHAVTGKPRKGEVLLEKVAAG